MQKKQLKEMFDNLLHIWNKTNFWNTKMRQDIYSWVNGIHVINLINTWKKIEEIKLELEKLSSEGKKILFVSTKIQSRDAFKNLAESTWNYYVCEKWVPGLLTNFKTIRVRINSYIKLLEQANNWWLDILTKKEKASKLLELEKLQKAFEWLKGMKKLPDLVFASDWVYEKQALKEAARLNIPRYAILNTNGDIDMVTNYIPANTNSEKSFSYIAKELKASIKTPKKQGTSIKKVAQRKVSWDKK